MTPAPKIAAMLELILASASPRRRELLAGAGISFTIDAAGLDERWLPGESPEAHCARLAAEKARAVSRKRPGALCLGADTIVTLDGEIFGKPADRDDARRMLSRLAGRAHVVHTAVALALDGALREQFTESARVIFRPLGDAELDWYLASDEPWDKAGAYAAQGRGAALIERIEGDFYAVVGLPVCATLGALQRQGITVFSPLK